jgi:sugar phosphate permease
MTTTIPLQYRKYGRVSAIAGFIDFSIYVGSGLSGVFTGLIADLLGWNSVFVLWAVAGAVGVAAMAVSVAKDRRRPVEAFDGALSVQESAQG